MKNMLGMNLFVHDAAFYLLDEDANLIFGVEEEVVVKTLYRMSASYFAPEHMLQRAKINKRDIIGVGLTSPLKEYKNYINRIKHFMEVLY